MMDLKQTKQAQQRPQLRRRKAPQSRWLHSDQISYLVVLYILSISVQLVVSNLETNGRESKGSDSTARESNDSTFRLESNGPNSFPNFTMPSNTTVKPITGNILWDKLLTECSRTKSLKSFSCIQRNVYSYFDEQLEFPGDYRITDYFVFKKNGKNFKYTREANNRTDGLETNEIDGSDGPPLEKHKEETVEEEKTFKSPFDEVMDALRTKSEKFMMTHDMEVALPDVMFDSATMRVSPRGFEGNGVLVKLEMIPKEIQESEARGVQSRLHFKKIKELFSGKLIKSFLAALLIIKLIKMKLMFLMPVLIGVGTAKKILLKVLLFLFPAFSHIFKLCSYYHATYHGTKYHHHHHQIQHVHRPSPNIIYPHGEYDHPPPHAAVYGVPPQHLGGHAGISLHHNPEIHIPPPKPTFHHETDGFELSGPGLGPEYISNRVSYDHEPSANDFNDIQAWGLIPEKYNKQPPAPGPIYNPLNAGGMKIPPSNGLVNTLPIPTKRPPVTTGGPLSKKEIIQMANKVEKDILLKQRLQQEKQRLQMENLRLQEQLRIQEQMRVQNEMKLQEMLKLQEAGRIGQKHQSYYKGNQAGQAVQAAPSVTSSQQSNVASLPNYPARRDSYQVGAQVASHVNNGLSPGGMFVMTQHGVAQEDGKTYVTPVPGGVYTQSPDVTYVTSPTKSQSKDYDPFYSPILHKIDAIFGKLGVSEETCRERLVCSMYKNPTKFSPHSNLMSAELSRDSKELVKPSGTNAAVVRFYRYIQAARDGQDRHDCLKLFPACSINTEKF